MLNWQKLSHLNQNQIKKLQDQKVRDFIKYQIPYHPYYSNVLKNIRIDFDNIRTTDDLQKIPFTSKEDIAPTLNNQKKPIDFVLQPNKELIKKYSPKTKLIKMGLKKIFQGQEKLKETIEKEYKPIHLHFTTGRTSLPVPFLYSFTDLERLKQGGIRLLDVFDIPPEEKAINGFPYAPHLAFWQVYWASIGAGITTLQTGGGKIMGTKKIIDSIERMKANTLIFMPGYAYHLLRIAVKEKRDFSSIKQVIFGGERVTPGLREKIKEFLEEMGARDVRVLATYAFTEGKTAWAQCHEQSGYHLYPDLEFIEIVDKNGQRLPSGENGEIVYTALDWRGSVVLRYRTGDLGSLEIGPCPYCGRTVPRIKPDIQRSSEFKEFELTKVKGTLINLNNFFPLLSGHSQIEEWQVEIRKLHDDPHEIDELYLYLAPKSGVSFAKLNQELSEKIKAEMEISPKIIELSLDELTRRLGMETELKEKRIVDLRM